MMQHTQEGMSGEVARRGQLPHHPPGMHAPFPPTRPSTHKPAPPHTLPPPQSAPQQVFVLCLQAAQPLLGGRQAGAARATHGRYLCGQRVNVRGGGCNVRLQRLLGAAVLRVQLGHLAFAGWRYHANRVCVCIGRGRTLALCTGGGCALPSTPASSPPQPPSTHTSGPPAITPRTCASALRFSSSRSASSSRTLSAFSCAQQMQCVGRPAGRIGRRVPRPGLAGPPVSR